MKNLDYDKTRLILILLFSIVASVLMIIFTIPKASALEVKSPRYIIGNTMYGYEVPTRDSLKGNTTKYYVNIGMNSIESNNVRQTINYGKGWLHPNNLPYELIQKDSTLNNSQLWTSAINTSQEIPIYYVPNGMNMGLQWGYHPGVPSNDYMDLFTTNDKFYYDGTYSYDFDIVVYGNGMSLNVSGDDSLIMNDNPFEYCFLSTVTNNMSCSTGAIYPSPRVSVIKRERDYVHYKVSIDINTYWGFNEQIYVNSNFQYDNVYFYNSKGFRLNGVPHITLGDKHYDYYFSEPYNIVYWSNQSSITCPDRCVTDDDANIDSNYNGNSELNGIDDFNNVISGLIDRDYGFGGIINITYGYIERVMSSYINTNCQELIIPIFDTNIVIPCGNSFWNREDIETFRLTYEMIFTGIISYWLCWVIYKYLMGLLDPFKKPINMKEVDSL